MTRTADRIRVTAEPSYPQWDDVDDPDLQCQILTDPFSDPKVQCPNMATTCIRWQPDGPDDSPYDRYVLVEKNDPAGSFCDYHGAWAKGEFEKGEREWRPNEGK